MVCISFKDAYVVYLHHQEGDQQSRSMPIGPAVKKLWQEEKLLPEAKQTISELLKFHKTIELFWGCELRSQKSLFSRSLNKIANKLHLNNPDGQEAYARQYQRTLFDWDATEATKVPEATKKNLEREYILFSIKVIVSNLKIFKAIFKLAKALWVGVKFCIVNGKITHYMQKMLPKHVIMPEIGSTTAKLARQLWTKADSPLEYLNDLLYDEPRMSEGCVSQLLACDEQYRGKLKALLMEYREVFPMELPKRVPPNRGLGDEMKTKLIPETEPIW